VSLLERVASLLLRGKPDDAETVRRLEAASALKFIEDWKARALD
jgi:hypothetical protein